MHAGAGGPTVGGGNHKDALEVRDKNFIIRTMTLQLLSLTILISVLMFVTQ